MHKLLRLQRALLNEINKYSAQVPDEERDEPADWERIHISSCARLGYTLAMERGVDPDLASYACAVHDFGRIVNGKQKGHAEFGYEPLREFLKGLEIFTDDEIDQISQAARDHSKKAEVGAPLDEIVKDADVLDYYWYGNEMPRQEQKDRLARLLGKEI